MAELGRMQAVIDNEHGASPLLLVCEHASNFMPPEFAGLGLAPAALEDHAAWDIGAHALARRLAQELDAPLVAAPASRLLVDPNRAYEAPDLIPVTAEGTPVPGNQALTDAERQARIRAFHQPFHDAIEALLARRGDIAALLAVHSFTPVLFGAVRPWHVGVLHGPDVRMAEIVLAELSRDASLKVGRNQPYAPEHGVFYTMDRRANGRATLMIEVRNDLLRDEAGLVHWSRLLADATSTALAALTQHRQAS